MDLSLDRGSSLVTAMPTYRPLSSSLEQVIFTTVESTSTVMAGTSPHRKENGFMDLSVDTNDGSHNGLDAEDKEGTPLPQQASMGRRDDRNDRVPMVVDPRGHSKREERISHSKLDEKNSQTEHLVSYIAKNDQSREVLCRVIEESKKSRYKVTSLNESE